jgi:hypothetical protein
MKTYTLKYENYTAEVEGDITFNSDGSINYVWSCTDLTIYKDSECVYSSYDGVSGSRLKHRLNGYVLESPRG